ncbi:MAG: metallophosphoesterase [Nitrospiraceae bacterium]|nr:metallophosphoesterase [Nitrospiraceae bacterium]
MIFFAVFFALYGFLHLYFYVKAVRAFRFTSMFRGLLALWLAAMTAAPVFIRLLEKAGYELPAQALSYAGYIWMGFIFLFVSAGILVDAFCLIKRLASGRAAGQGCRAVTNFWIPAAAACLICVYGYFDALNIRTERVEVYSEKIPVAAGRITVAQISDVHLGLIVREQRLKKIIKVLKAENPDIIVSTGDLVDGQMDSMNTLTGILKTVQPRYGKFAVTGNHEYYAGIGQAVAFTEAAGFRMLRGEAADISTFLTIAGVEDPVSGINKMAQRDSEKFLLSSISAEKFRILLKHRPLVNDSSEGLFDLQLSGHVHKGQIFPFSLFTWLYYPADAGFVRMQKSALYISRGTGTWGPPIRFLAPPEITIFELKPAKR